MTLTEALQKSPYVRRQAWIWSRYWGYDPNGKEWNPGGHPHVWWGDSNNPRTNHLNDMIPFEDAIAEDWEAIEDAP